MRKLYNGHANHRGNASLTRVIKFLVKIALISLAKTASRFQVEIFELLTSTNFIIMHDFLSNPLKWKKDLSYQDALNSE